MRIVLLDGTTFEVDLAPLDSLEIMRAAANRSKDPLHETGSTPRETSRPTPDGGRSAMPGA